MYKKILKVKKKLNDMETSGYALTKWWEAQKMDRHVCAKVKMVSKQNTGRKAFFFFK